MRDSVLALPTTERHEFAAWVNWLETNYGDLPGEALDQLAAEIMEEAGGVVAAGRGASDLE